VISVVLPVFRADRAHLDEAIASVLRSPVDLELLLVEDAGEVAVDSPGDSRVRHLVNPNRNGLGAALNYAIANARGSLIARMDADDISEPERFPKQLAMFEADPALTVAGSQLLIVDESGVPIGRRIYPMSHAAIASTLTRYNCIAHPAVMFRRSAFERAGGYAEGVLAEDYDLWCRMLLAGARFANHPEALVRYRFHAAALKHRTVRPALRETIDLKVRNFGPSLGPRARARLLAERILLRLPESVVIRLFAPMVYRRL
jgi:glycosyltransferase involved in cell wall biosynthesis